MIQRHDAVVAYVDQVNPDKQIRNIGLTAAASRNRPGSLSYFSMHVASRRERGRSTVGRGSIMLALTINPGCCRTTLKLPCNGANHEYSCHAPKPSRRNYTSYSASVSPDLVCTFPRRSFCADPTQPVVPCVDRGHCPHPCQLLRILIN